MMEDVGEGEESVLTAEDRTQGLKRRFVLGEAEDALEPAAAENTF